MNVSRKAAEFFFREPARNRVISRNTKIIVEHEMVKLSLFDNIISIREVGNRENFIITNCGWESVTTKERLNLVLQQAGVKRSIHTRNGVWIWNNGDPFEKNIYYEIQTND